MPGVEIDDLLKGLTGSSLLTDNELKAIADLAVKGQSSHFRDVAQTVLLFKASRETTLAVAKMTEAIDRFNEQTDKQTKKMLFWTKALAALTVILAFQTAWLILSQ